METFVSAAAGFPATFFNVALLAALLVLSRVDSWRVTRGVVRPPAKLTPDEPGASRPDAAPDPGPRTSHG